MSLAIQGVAVEPRDIDILTTERGALLADEVLGEYRIQAPNYSQTEMFRSFYGIYAIDSIKVDVIGEFQYRLKSGDWSVPNQTHPTEIINYCGMKLRVLSLEQELVEYENIGKNPTIEAIRRALG